MTQKTTPSLDVHIPTPRLGEPLDDWVRTGLVPFLADELRLLRKQLNNITALNMSAHYQTGITTPGVADTEFTITHNLGRVPQIVICNVDTHATIRDSQRANWTSTQLFLKCSAATVSLTVLVL